MLFERNKLYIVAHKENLQPEDDILPEKWKDALTSFCSEQMAIKHIAGLGYNSFVTRIFSVDHNATVINYTCKYINGRLRLIPIE